MIVARVGARDLQDRHVLNTTREVVTATKDLVQGLRREKEVRKGIMIGLGRPNGGGVEVMSIEALVNIRVLVHDLVQEDEDPEVVPRTAKDAEEKRERRRKRKKRWVDVCGRIK
jgi:hypothetical protein